MVFVDEKCAGHKQGITNRATDAVPFEHCLDTPNQSAWAKELRPGTTHQAKRRIKLFRRI